MLTTVCPFARLGGAGQRAFVASIDRTPFALDVDETERFAMGRTMRHFTRLRIAEFRVFITSKRFILFSFFISMFLIIFKFYFI